MIYRIFLLILIFTRSALLASTSDKPDDEGKQEPGTARASQIVLSVRDNPEVNERTPDQERSYRAQIHPTTSHRKNAISFQTFADLVQPSVIHYIVDNEDSKLIQKRSIVDPQTNLQPVYDRLTGQYLELNKVNDNSPLFSTESTARSVVQNEPNPKMDRVGHVYDESASYTGNYGSFIDIPKINRKSSSQGQELNVEDYSQDEHDRSIQGTDPEYIEGFIVRDPLESKDTTIYPKYSGKSERNSYKNYGGTSGTHQENLGDSLINQQEQISQLHNMGLPPNAYYYSTNINPFATKEKHTVNSGTSSNSFDGYSYSGSSYSTLPDDIGNLPQDNENVNIYQQKIPYNTFGVGSSDPNNDQNYGPTQPIEDYSSQQVDNGELLTPNQELYSNVNDYPPVLFDRPLKKKKKIGRITGKETTLLPSRYTTGSIKFALPEEENDQDHDYSSVSYQKMNTGDQDGLLPKSYSKLNLYDNSQSVAKPYTTSDNFAHDTQGLGAQYSDILTSPYFEGDPSSSLRVVKQKYFTTPNPEIEKAFSNQYYQNSPADISVGPSHSLDSVQYGSSNIELNPSGDLSSALTNVEILKTNANPSIPNTPFSNPTALNNYNIGMTQAIIPDKAYNYLGERVDQQQQQPVIGGNVVDYFKNKNDYMPYADANEPMFPDQLAQESLLEGSYPGRFVEAPKDVIYGNSGSVMFEADGGKQSEWKGLGSYPGDNEVFPDYAYLPTDLQQESVRPSKYRTSSRYRGSKRPVLDAQDSPATQSPRYRSRHRGRGSSGSSIQRPKPSSLRQTYRPPQQPLRDSSSASTFQDTIQHSYYPVKSSLREEKIRAMGALEDALAIQGARHKTRNPSGLKTKEVPSRLPSGTKVNPFKHSHAIVTRPPNKDLHIYIQPEFPEIDNQAALVGSGPRPVFGTRLPKKSRKYKRRLPRPFRYRNSPLKMSGSSNIRYIRTLPKETKRPIRPMFRQKRRRSPGMRNLVLLRRPHYSFL